MRIPKNISLDEKTHEIASDINDFSGWVRARLLEWDEAGRPAGSSIAEVDAILRTRNERRLAVILFNTAEPGSDLQAALGKFVGAAGFTEATE